MFKELDYQPTAIGELTLRQRTDPQFADQVIFEVKLGDEFLMSSLVTAGEIALANLALARLPGNELEVVVGGLGLGYTAAAALAFPSIRSLLIVEALAPVIDWHKRGLVPLGTSLANDPRCSFHCADFFSIALTDDGFAPQANQKFDAILLDIDHSPRHLLTDQLLAANKIEQPDFYHATNLHKMAQHLKPNGLFAMWSNDPPDDIFLGSLTEAFSTAEAEICEFPNPYTDEKSANTIYLAQR